MAPPQRKTAATKKMASTALKKRQGFKLATSDRDSSPELGDETIFVKRNMKTGKPIRTSAGKRSLPAGFVATEDAITGNLDLDEDDSSSDSSTDLDIDVIKAKPAKRRRMLETAPALSPLRDMDDTDPELSTGGFHASPKALQELSLTIVGPARHSGPMAVKLDLNSMTGGFQSQTSLPLTPTSLSVDLSETASNKSENTLRQERARATLIKHKKPKVGFLDLAAETRNQIYRLALVNKEPVEFRGPFSPARSASHLHRQFCHSGAFLRTCRQVYEEARSFLYGENMFKFNRDGRLRGNYFEEWKQIGWKDVHRFLTSIGSINISQLRHVQFSFTDTYKDEYNPSFVHDDFVIECFKLLATHGALETIEIIFLSHNIALKKSDGRFIHYLSSIKADKVVLLPNEIDRHHHLHTTAKQTLTRKVDKEIRKELMRKIKRVTKLYEVKK